MTDPLVDDDGAPTPLGAAIMEITHCRGYTFRHACKLLTRRFQGDCQCPACAMFRPDEVRRFYKKKGHRVNVVPLPRTMSVR